MRRYAVDTFALLLFSTLAGAFTELVIAGLTWEQTLRARLTALPVVIITARPYGVYRDWLRNRCSRGGRVADSAVDTAAFVSFQLPIYWAILALSGASANQIARASATAIVVLLVSGRPYGFLLDRVRALFGIYGHADTLRRSPV
jgi:L-alanine exporter